MSTRDDSAPETVLVAWGSLSDGYDFYGPFPDPFKAREWVKKKFDSEDCLSSIALQERYTLVWCKKP